MLILTLYTDRTMLEKNYDFNTDLFLPAFPPFLLEDFLPPSFLLDSLGLAQRSRDLAGEHTPEVSLKELFRD